MASCGFKPLAPLAGVGVLGQLKSTTRPRMALQKLNGSLFTCAAVYQNKVEVPGCADLKSLAVILLQNCARFDSELIDPAIDPGLNQLLYPMPRLSFIVLSPEFYRQQRSFYGTVRMWIRSVASEATFVREFYLCGGVGDEVMAAGAIVTRMTRIPSVEPFHPLPGEFLNTVTSKLSHVQENHQVFEPEHFINRINPGRAVYWFHRNSQDSVKPVSTMLMTPEKLIHSHRHCFSHLVDYFQPHGEQYLSKTYGGSWRLIGACFPYTMGVRLESILISNLYEGEPEWSLQFLEPLSFESSRRQLAFWPHIRGRYLADYIRCDKVLQHELWRKLNGEAGSIKNCFGCTYWTRMESGRLSTNATLVEQLNRAPPSGLYPWLSLTGASGWELEE